jgi:PAS domain S-box-containing protein
MINNSKKIAIFYFLLSVTWIYLSDAIIDIIFPFISSRSLYVINIVKGVGFVSLTALLLYKFINKNYEDLNQSQKEYFNLFDANPNPMWVYDSKTLKFLLVNQAAVDKYGYSKEEFLSLNGFDIRPSHEHDIFEKYIKTSDDSFKHHGIWTHLLKNKKEIQVNIHSHSLIYKKKEAKLVMAIDFTERLMYKQKLQEHLVELGKANLKLEEGIEELKKREAFIENQNQILKKAAWINSHQVRKPLASILGLIEILQSSDDVKEAKKCIEFLKVCSEELDEMIKSSSEMIESEKN